MKDRNSDGQLTTAVANSFQIYACKLLKTLYLFASLDPVNLNANVSVTEKTRHSSARLSRYRNKARMLSADYADHADVFINESA